MSFQDIGGPKGGGHASKSQPKQRRVDEDSTFEKEIRSHIQQMQESVRNTSEQLERMQRGFSSKRVKDSMSKSLAQSRDLAQVTEHLFRDWTVHLAGEPTKRHRSKFSLEKLQKAFEEEVSQLKDLARRVSIAEQEIAERGPTADPVEFQPMCNDQGAHDEECGILDTAGDAWQQQQAQESMMSRITEERQEGIRRIQTQVCEVNQIVRDLASIVTEQGSVLNTIEQQAEVAVNETQGATRELRKAADRHRSTRDQFMCLLAAALLVFVFIIMPHLHRGQEEGASIIVKQDSSDMQ